MKILKYDHSKCNKVVQKDLLVMLVAESLFILNSEPTKEINNVNRDYGYKFKDGYEDMINEISKNILDQIESIKDSFDDDCKARVRSMIRDKLMEAINILKMQDNVILDVLASYILFSHFSRTREVLYDVFEPLSDSSMYGTIVDTLDDSGLKLRDKHDMVILSKKVLERI